MAAGTDREGVIETPLIITGVPGTGKTAVAQYLARRLNWRVVNPGDQAKQRGKGHWEEAFVVDIKWVCGNRWSHEIWESHLLCECPFKKAIVLRTAPIILRKRLEKRGYPEWKLDRNLSAEILDYCGKRIEDNGGVPLYVDSGGHVKSTADMVMKAWREGRSFPTWADEPEVHLREYFENGRV